MKNNSSPAKFILIGFVGAITAYLGSDYNSTRDGVDLFQLISGLAIIAMSIYGWMKQSGKV